MPSDWISAGGSINQEEEEKYQEEKEEEGNSWHSDGAGLLPIGKAPAGRSFDHPPSCHQWMATIVEDHLQQNCKNGWLFFGPSSNAVSAFDGKPATIVCYWWPDVFFAPSTDLGIDTVQITTQKTTKLLSDHFWCMRTSKWLRKNIWQLEAPLVGCCFIDQC